MKKIVLVEWNIYLANQTNKYLLFYSTAVANEFKNIFKHWFKIKGSFKIIDSTYFSDNQEYIITT